MKAAKGVFSLLVLVVTLVAVLAPTLALAQSDEDRNAALLGGGILLVCAVIGLAFYVYLALAVYTIANKTHTENAWLAWIPILNAILMVNIAKKPIWWAIIIIFVPLVNIVFLILVWMAMAEARGKPSWWGIMIIVPLMQLITPGYLAWAD